MDLVKTSFDLSMPQQALEVATVLQKFVKDKNLTSNIKGKNYPLVDAWQFAGSQLGLYPLLTETKDLCDDKQIRYSATVEIRRLDNDRIVSRGVAICSNKEASKRQFDEYAILSMAQTRAEGKAFRMLLAWLMKAAGFEATPAEEMDFNKSEVNDDLLFTWEAELNNCKIKSDLVALYSGNKASVDGSPQIKALFKKREQELAA
jgi:hypothetical protein